jgi:hypothetical protein
MKLQAGDCFVVRGNTNISYLIRVAGKFWSTDGECTYNHAGIILNEEGNTFESLNRIDHYKLDGYKGKQIMIVRHKGMNNERYTDGWNFIKRLDGVIYPYWRLALHLVHLARLFNRSGIPVCSELVGMFENGADLREVFWGLTPDNLADEWRISKYYDIIYEGVYE